MLFQEGPRKTHCTMYSFIPRSVSRTSKPGRDKMAILYEQYTACDGKWSRSSLVVSLRERHSTKKRGCRKWLTFKQLIDKYQSVEAAEEIIMNKLSDERMAKEDVKPHPDTPLNPQLTLFRVWDEEGECDETDEVLESFFSMTQDDDLKSSKRSRSEKKKKRKSSSSSSKGSSSSKSSCDDSDDDSSSTSSKKAKKSKKGRKDKKTKKGKKAKKGKKDKKDKKGNRSKNRGKKTKKETAKELQAKAAREKKKEEEKAQKEKEKEEAKLRKQAEQEKESERKQKKAEAMKVARDVALCRVLNRMSSILP